MLTGCSSAADKETEASPSAPASASASAPAVKGAGKSDAWKKADTRIGDAGTACELPVSFEAVKAWKPTGLSREDGELLGKFSGHTTFRGACELDAKPAGNIGFIRVWTADNMTDKSPRQVLEAFMSEEKRATDQQFSEVKAGELPAAEVVYKVKTVLADEPKPERALAVSTPKGVTVVHLGGFDAQEHEEMLPAFERAKKTVRLAS
ncbi:lipoprotein [Streptomyces olivoreticuli]